MTKKEFLKDCANWDNHRHLLWPALEATSGDVIEMGMGAGSTPFLHQYCEDNVRKLYSYDNSTEWAKRFIDLKSPCHHVGAVVSWDEISETHPAPDVVLIDHAPGERRYIDVQRYANSAKILVIHDSEPAATGYMMDKIWHLFKYRIDWKTEGAWATAVSNFIDVSKFEI
jgi:hypothetical protein